MDEDLEFEGDAVTEADDIEDPEFEDDEDELVDDDLVDDEHRWTTSKSVGDVVDERGR